MDTTDITDQYARDIVREILSEFPVDYNFVDKVGDNHFSPVYGNVVIKEIESPYRGAVGLYCHPGQCGTCIVTGVHMVEPYIDALIDIATQLGFGKMVITDTEEREFLSAKEFVLVDQFINPRTLNEVFQYEKIINET